MQDHDQPMPANQFLTAPLRDLDAWTNHFRNAQIAVQADTADTLEALRQNEDDVDANLLGDMFSSDPLMTLKVLEYGARNRPKRLVTETETVTAALVMMGISPFFGAFGVQPTVEDLLQDQPEAFRGLQEVMRRAHRAANFALGFAVHRMDHDAAVIYQAALLHDFAEMLLWCHAPSLALRIREAQKADPTLRSSSIQQDVLNIHLVDLQQSLMKAWHLPETLVRMTDDRHAEHPSARTVLLAIRLARHTSEGWENAALPDDVKDISELLNLSPAATLQLLHDIEPN